MTAHRLVTGGTLTVAALAAAATLVLWATHERGTPGGTLTLLWSLSPYAGLCLTGMLLRKTLVASAVVLLGVVLLSGVGVFGLYDALLVAEPGTEKHAFAFVYVPLIQWVGVALLLPLLAAVRLTTWLFYDARRGANGVHQSE
jgi:hypothetical protein